MSKLIRETLSQHWITIQGSLFPWLTQELGELTKKHQELVTTLELLRIERFTYSNRGFPGCPLKSRNAIARAFEEFSRTQLPQRVYEIFIKAHYADEIIGHNSRDSTAIDTREKRALNLAKSHKMTI